MSEDEIYREEALDIAYQDFQTIVKWFAKGIGEEDDLTYCSKLLLSEFLDRILAQQELDNV